jgi:hypothetical protein
MIAEQRGLPTGARRRKAKGEAQWETIVRLASIRATRLGHTQTLLGSFEFTQQLLDVVCELTFKGERVRFPGFGIFYVHKYPTGTRVLKFSAARIRKVRGAA